MAHVGKKDLLIAVCSAVGGVGRTTVTANLAVLLASRNTSVTVIDADLQFGDLAMALDLKPVHTMKEAAEQQDASNAKFFCTRHSLELRLLAAPTRPEYADIISTDALQAVIDSLRAETDVTLVEAQAGLNEQNLQIMEIADAIFIVTTPSMAALKNTRLMIETLHALGLRGKVQLIVNKSTETAVIDIKRIRDLITIDHVHVLPDDPKQISESLDLGIPFVTRFPKHAFTKSMENLAVELVPDEQLNKKESGLHTFFNRTLARLEGRSR